MLLLQVAFYVISGVRVVRRKYQ